MEAASEQMHRLADTTYRNIEELVGDLKTLATAAKSYQRAMEGMVSASGHFFSIVESIGAKASNLPGAVNKLGECMMEMVSGHEQIKNHQQDWIQSFETDFVVPLETKLDTESKNLSAIHKMYKQDNSKRSSLVEKTGSKLKAVQKKKTQSREQIEKETQLKQVLTDYSNELHTTRVEGLRKALIEERKLYCFVVEHFCSVIHNQIAYNALSHQVLSTKVTDWSTQCSSPNELPSESAILLVDPRSPRAYPTSPHNGNGEQMMDGRTNGGSPKLRRSSSQRSDQSVPASKLRARRVSCRVKALYPHQVAAAGGGGQLDFTPGDLIDALDEPQEGWQFGENTRTGNTGWFPVQYVDKIWPTPEPRRKKREDVDRPQPPSSHSSSTGLPERDYNSPISKRSGRDDNR